MFNFNYYTPTRVVFGKGTESQVGELTKAQGCKKVLIHYGGGSVIRSGLMDKVKKALDAEGISYVELGGVVPNPRLSKVYEGVELCKKENVDFILAVGGGSAIDSAKAIAYGAVYDGDVWDFYDKKAAATKALPVGVVLTLAATGSEMSDSSVITKEEGELKHGYNNDICRPVFAVMNPELTMTLPDYQTACGCADILMHTMERYFSNGGTMEITDSIAEALMRTVITYSKVLVENPGDYEARAEIMWAGSVSHNGMTGCGTCGGDWVCHRMEHEIGGLFDVAHGAGLAAIWGSWARFVHEDCMDRFKKFALNVMQVEDKGSDEEIIENGIKAMEDFYRLIKMPTSLTELGIKPTDEDIALMAKKCMVVMGDPAGSAKQLHEADVAAIYTNAK